MDLSVFYNQFRDETAEHVRTLNEGLLALEHEQDPAAYQERLAAIFRAMHTVKGSARVLGFEPVARLAHGLEHQLGALRSGTLRLDHRLTDLLLRGGDIVMALTEAAIAGSPTSFDPDPFLAELQHDPTHEPEPVAPEPTQSAVLPTAAASAIPAPTLTGATVRVRVDRLDRMLHLVGALMVGQQTIVSHLEALRALRLVAQQSERALQALEQELARLRFSPIQRRALDQHLAAVRNTTHQAVTDLEQQFDAFERFADHAHLTGKELEQEVIQVRLVPIAMLYASLPRAVRDLELSTGKEVQLDLQGEATELDRRVLELLNDPLLHLVRNAVDHGIEAPDAREAAGKPRQGQLTVSAEAFGNEIQLKVADDGRGLDLQALRRRAVRIGLFSEEQIVELSETDTCDLIFAPGLSTVESVTDISGRGVGMDLVRTNLIELGGRIQVDTRPGQGTCFSLFLPLTLVTTRVVLVQAGCRQFALPVSRCAGTRWWHQDSASARDVRPTLVHDEQQIALFALAELLEPGQRVALRERVPVVLIGDGRDRVGLMVDSVVDEREVVVKSLGPLFAHQRAFSGVAQLDDGRLVLLLNPDRLSWQIRNGAMPMPA